MKASYRIWLRMFTTVCREELHWVVEVKMDKEMSSADVKGKRDTARRWANYVSGDDKVGACWRYLLDSKADLRTSSGR
jgi:type III restriction enzyme